MLPTCLEVWRRRQRTFFTAAISATRGNDAALFPHDDNVSINLARQSRPCASEKSQKIGFSFTVRGLHQAATFR